MSELQPATDSLEYYGSANPRYSDGISYEISLVVTSYTQKRFADLSDLLRTIENQSIPIELILVIEKDELLKDYLLDALKERSIRWLMIFSPVRLGISHARNIGIRHSTSSLIGFADDDAMLSSDWVRQVVLSFRKYPLAIGVTGAVLPLWIDGHPRWFPQSLYWIIGCTDWRNVYFEELGLTLAGVNMIFRREAFDSAQFIDKFTDGAQEEGKLGLPNEDNDFAMRITAITRKKIVYTPAVRVWHKVRSFKLTNQYIKRYSFWQGVAEARYDRMYSMKSRRKSRQRILLGIARDIFYLGHDGRKRLMALVLSIIFGSLGYFSYEHKLLLNIGNRLL